MSSSRLQRRDDAGAQMVIPSSELLRHIHPEAEFVVVRGTNGSPVGEISTEHLKLLVLRGQVVGKARGRKLREIRLTCHPDVAFQGIGELIARGFQDRFENEANSTTQRSSEILPKYIVRHRLDHCLAWPSKRHSLPAIPGRFIPGKQNLTERERLSIGSSCLRPPLRMGA